MRRILFALAIALLVSSGCAKDEPGKTGGSKTETPPAETHTAALTETTAPKYFLPLAMFPDGSFFGLPDNQMTSWNDQTGETKTLGDAWSGVLSPDGKKIAFQDEYGLYVLDVDAGKSKMIASNSRQDGSSLAPGIWSPDSDQFLYMYVMEWSADYFVYHIETGTRTAYKFKNIPNFLTGPVDWRDTGLLFVACANKSQTGEQEYRESGYRSDLMLADEKGFFTPLTRLEDGQFALFGGTTKDNDKIMVLIREENGPGSAGLVQPGKDEIELLPVEGNVVGGTISPDGKFAVLITLLDLQRFNVQVFDLQNKTGILEEELTGDKQPRDFIWDDAGQAVYFGMLGADDNGILYTINFDDHGTTPSAAK